MKEIVGRWCKIAENTSTYLSRRVQDLVLKKGFAETASRDASLKCDTDDLLDISNVSSLLRNADEICFTQTQLSVMQNGTAKSLRMLHPFLQMLE